MEISPELIHKLALVVRHNVLGLQKMEDNLLVYNAKITKFSLLENFPTPIKNVV